MPSNTSAVVASGPAVSSAERLVVPLTEAIPAKPASRKKAESSENSRKVSTCGPAPLPLAIRKQEASVTISQLKKNSRLVEERSSAGIESSSTASIGK